MKTQALRATFVLLGLIGMGIAVSGCNEEPPASLYNEDWKSTGQPVISSISLPAAAYGGADIITITGSNFSPVLDDNLVFFDAAEGLVLSASPTELRVRTPDMTKDTVILRIAVRGSSLFSEPRQYRLMAPVTFYGGFGLSDAVASVTAAKSGTLFYTATAKILGRVLPDSAKVQIATMQISVATDLKVGADGFVYCTGGLGAQRYIFRFSSDGVGGTWLRLPSSTTSLDQAQNGYLYAGGLRTAIYRVNTSGSTFKAVGQVPDVDIQSLRFFGGYLYFSGKYTGTDSIPVGSDKIRNGDQGIWRVQVVSDDTVSEKELYFHWKGFSSKVAYTLAFAADGDLFVGTDDAMALAVIHPNKTAEEFYPGVGLINSSITTMTYLGQYLYAFRENTTTLAERKLLKINTQKDAAPNYGG